jgi:hypothetical protein
MSLINRRIFEPSWMARFWVWGFVALLGGFALGGFVPLVSQAEEARDTGTKNGYHDIYLTENRVCRKCTATRISPEQVQLINRQGERITVPINTILGVDRHPVVRKLLVRSLHGVGNPGPEIVPYAFEDWNEYVCKYCDEEAH